MKLNALERIRVAFVTLGCAKNEVDTSRMRDKVIAAGMELTDSIEEAEVVVVNTCSFIQEATEESLEAIFELSDLDAVKSGKTRLIVAGCMPSRYGKDLEGELKEATAFLPCDKEESIVQVIEDLLGIEVSATKPFDQAVQINLNDEKSRELSPSVYVKISEGCDRYCSYCTIPFIRGRYRSYPLDEIEGDVQSKIVRGAREIVLIAQDTGRWGKDLPGELDLAHLLKTLAAKHPDTWFRMMYLQPEGVSEALLEVVATFPNICKYLDIPFQHSNTEILSLMNRTGSSKEYKALITHIRECIPSITLRTTMIAGFPGETEKAFEELCAFIEECDFDYVGVFPYSQEEGTKAAELPGQIDEPTKLNRAQRIRDLADALSISKISAKVDTELDVLILGKDEEGQLFGRAQCQAPDVDGVVFLETGKIGDIISLIVEDTFLYDMEGK